MNGDLRHIARAGSIALASISTLFAGLLEADELNGVEYVVVVGITSIGAIFLSDISGGIAGAVRAVTSQPSWTERKALLAKVSTSTLRKVGINPGTGERQ